MAVLPLTAARVFFDGTFAEPRLAHPEGVAVHADGSIWCGTEWGDIIRVAADGSSHALVGTTGGFALGLAFDSAGNCYVCDLKHKAVFKYDAASGTVSRFTPSGILVPNYPVVDEKRGVLYVSDSRGNGNIGPGVYRYDLKTGQGGVWCEAPMDFANGMAMALDGSGLTWSRVTGRRSAMYRSIRMAQPVRRASLSPASATCPMASPLRQTAPSMSAAMSRAASTASGPTQSSRFSSRIPPPR